MLGAATLGACALALVLLTGGGAGSEEPPAALAGEGPPAEAPSNGLVTDQVALDARGPLIEGFDDPVPILMYHVIADAPPDAAYPGLFVPPRELREQLRWLASEGFNAVTQEELFAAWQDGSPIPENPVVLSFDDGTVSHRTVAMPMLARRGWPGVLNLKVGALDEGDITAPMVREMLAAGWELSSHTLTHPDLTTLGDEELRRELQGSKRLLERRFGVDVDFLCYPAGAHDDRVVGAAREAGYRGATTTLAGLAGPEDSMRLRRIRIEPGDGAAGLASKLRAAGLEATS